MKDRLSKISKRATHALCLLAACGLTYSCADEYKWDDEAPTSFHTSIYSYLAEGKGYTTFVKLIDDLGYKEDLSRTGSRTLFVANDSAFARFFRENALRPEQDPWHYATSYDKLSLAQKKILLKSAMLNNAYLMEMMSRSEGNPPTPGMYMRKTTGINLFDSLTVVTPEMLPTSESTTDKKYWEDLRDKENIRLLSDNSTPMMVFFSEDFMTKSGISDEDFLELFGEKREFNQFYIYQNKVIKKDIACQNGYVHELNNVLLPEPNMAEIIRNSGKTNIFSHILDRFSAPYIDKDAAVNYKKEYGEDLTFYVRKYYSELTNTAAVSDYLVDGTLSKGPDGEDPIVDDEAFGAGFLKFDPGWNQYTSGSSANADMAAMFVPIDDAMRKYFKEGAGRTLLENYGDPDRLDSDDDADLYYNIDQIPLNVLYSFVSNLMQKSFISSVPSKFGTILDQANDNLFKDPQKVIDEELDEIKVGNNGAVYFMKEVYSPVDFSCVASPAFIGKDYKLMKFAIYSGAPGLWNTELMNKMNFFAYLRASGERIKFSLFLPSDKALENYIDPLSIVPGKEGMARVLSYTYKYNGKDQAPFTCRAYRMDLATGLKKPDDRGTAVSTAVGSASLNRLCDILETHTVIHDLDKDPLGLESGNKYFLSKSGSPIFVDRSSGALAVSGGMQIANGYTAPKVIEEFKQADPGQSNGLTNGTTYCLDAVIQPSVKSVYKTMSEMSNQKFFQLCNGITDDLLLKTGLVVLPDNVSPDERNTKLDMYKIFSNNYKGLDYNVTFLANYNYTVYVPTDQAIEDEINNKGLPTPETISEYIEAHEEDPAWESEYKEKAKHQLQLLLNFIRMHFQDNSIFADTNAGGKKSYNSAAMDEDGTHFVKIESELLSGERIILKDEDGKYDCEVIGEKNLMARDYVTSHNYATVTDVSSVTINSSAFCVVHEIDGVLRNLNLNDYQGNYKNIWDNATTAQKVLGKFRIKNK